MWRAITVILLTYVTLDFADPNLPGALNFDIDQSIDGVHTQLRGQSPIAKAVSVPSPLFVRAATERKTPIVPRLVTVSVRVAPVDARPRALLSRVLASDSPEAH
ncbi:MAG TPA: hypothetical protein VIE36_16560 [Methylomirabilota bacterium]|jgi:hypothetical protein